MSLPSRQRTLREHQFSKRFWNVEIRRWRSRRLPSRIETRLGTSFDAVKIHSPGNCRVKVRDDAFRRQREFRDPCLGDFVQNNAPPQTALQVTFFARRDVQIDPKPVRTHFEFLIPAELRPVGLQKNFRDVAIPELITVPIGLGIRENRDHSKPRVKSYKKQL